MNFLFSILFTLLGRSNLVETTDNGAEPGGKHDTRREEAADRKIRARKLERLLKKKLSEFLDSTVLYSLRRVLPAELNTTYVKQFSAESQPSLDKSDRLVRSLMSDSSETCEPNEMKGGFRITRYLTYNCLVSDATTDIAGEYSGNMQRHWKCTHCTRDFVFNLKERMEHEVSCQLNSEAVGEETAARRMVAGTGKVPNGVDYFCPVCKETLNLTPVDILKHKRSHL